MKESICNSIAILALVGALALYQLVCSQLMPAYLPAPNLLDILDADKRTNATTLEEHYNTAIGAWHSDQSCSVCKHVASQIAHSYSTLTNEELRNAYIKENSIYSDDEVAPLTSLNFNKVVENHVWLIGIDKFDSMNLLLTLNESFRIGAMKSKDSALMRHLGIKSDTNYIVYSSNGIIQIKDEITESNVEAILRRALLKEVPTVTYDNVAETLKYEHYYLHEQEFPAFNRFTFALASRNANPVPLQIISYRLKYSHLFDVMNVAPIDRIRLLKRFEKSINDNVLIAYSYAKEDKMLRMMRFITTNLYSYFNVSIAIDLLAKHTIVPLFQDNLHDTCRGVNCIVLLYSSEFIAKHNITQIVAEYQNSVIIHLQNALNTSTLSSLQFGCLDIDYHPKLKRIFDLSGDNSIYMLLKYSQNAYLTGSYNDIISAVPAEKWNEFEEPIAHLLERSDSFLSKSLVKQYDSCAPVALCAAVLAGILCYQNKITKMLSVSMVLMSYILSAAAVAYLRRL